MDLPREEPAWNEAQDGRDTELSNFIAELRRHGLDPEPAEWSESGSPIGRLFLPHVHWDRLSGAVLERGGRILAATPAFAFNGEDLDRELAAREPQAGAGPRLVSLFQADGRPQLIAAGDPDSAQDWVLPDTLREAAARPEARWVVLSAAQVRSHEAILDACRALGLTDMQSRLTAALVRTGDLRAAASEIGVTYGSAREAISIALRRVGLRRQSALVDRVVQLSFGVAPHDQQRDALLRDVWGLTPRQAGLAAAVAQGASRADAARAVGVSEAVAKKELVSIFLSLGVSSATELSVVLGEARALASLVKATRGGLAVAADRMEPLRLFNRPGGAGVVAVSDYGPAGGQPVLVIHNSSSSRPAPSVLVAALHELGFRPFSIDRPGFGLTDMRAGDPDPFRAAVDDVRLVCERLKIDRFDVLARGGAQVAVHLADAAPELVRRVLLVAPDPPTSASAPGSPLLATVKAAFMANPGFIAPLARMFVSNLTVERLHDLVLRPFEAEGPDAEAMRDPRLFADFCRGITMFMAGRIEGYVREQAAMTAGAPLPPLATTAHWRVMIGARDPLHDPEETAEYWRAQLPDAEFLMTPDGGRFLALTHAKIVAYTLATAPEPVS